MSVNYTSFGVQKRRIDFLRCGGVSYLHRADEPKRSLHTEEDDTFMTMLTGRSCLRRTAIRLRRNWGLLLLLLPSLIFAAIFMYRPMVGILIAFKNYKPAKGILGSPWAAEHGLKYFRMFFETYNCWTVIWNTVAISLYALAAGFPIPIVFALLLNQMQRQRYKKVVQTVTYAPHFISMVVLVGIIRIVFAPSSGLVNLALDAMGMKKIMFLTSPEWFRHLYVWSGVWQSTGWNSIIYIAALSNVSPELHEAAKVDGASKLQRILYVDFPSILPTAVTLLILNTGKIMTVGFEKVYLMQTSLNLSTSEVLSTYVYKIGLINGQFSLSTAVGLFNSAVNLLMLLIVNFISRRLTDTSLW